MDVRRSLDYVEQRERKMSVFVFSCCGFSFFLVSLVDSFPIYFDFSPFVTGV